MTPKEFVRMVYPSAHIRREGVKVLIVRSSSGLAGWTPLSGMHYSETDAWSDAKDRLPISVA